MGGRGRDSIEAKAILKGGHRALDCVERGVYSRSTPALWACAGRSLPIESVTESFVGGSRHNAHFLEQPVSLRKPAAAPLGSPGDDRIDAHRVVESQR